MLIMAHCYIIWPEKITLNAFGIKCKQNQPQTFVGILEFRLPRFVCDEF